MDFGFTDEQNMLRDSVRKLMDKHAPPEYIRRLDREQAYPYELYDAWVEAGLLAHAVSRGIWRARRQRDRHGDHRRGDLAHSSADLCMAYRRQHVLRPQHPAQGHRRSRSAIGCRSCCRARSGCRSRCRSPMPAPMSARCARPRGATATTGSINGQKLWATGAAAKNNVINMYVKTDTKAHYRQGMSLFLVDNDTPGHRDAQARHARAALHRHLRDLPQRRARAGRPARRRREQGLGCRALRAAGRARRLRRRRAAAARAAVRRPRARNTPRSASSSAGRSAPSRRSRTCSPTCRPRSRRRGR